MFNAAIYAAPLPGSSAGGDPLDLGSVNEWLYNTVFPGYNNTVRHIRVYSALCWMVAQVEVAYPDKEGEEFREVKTELELALQKVELALLWANPDLKGELIGISRSFPKTEGLATLSFASRLSSAGKSVVATFRGAGAYGPSLTNGLEFVDSNYACTEYGKALAAAFESRLATLPPCKWLRNVKTHAARHSDIVSAHPALRLDIRPSANERKAFLESFFPQGLENAGELRTNRWLSLHLVLNAVHANANGSEADSDTTEDEIRASMARGLSTSGENVVLPGLEEIQAYWAILQVRQLLRPAAETLFCIAERWILRAELEAAPRQIEDCVEDISKAVMPCFPESTTLQELTATFTSAQGSYPTLYAAAADQPGTPADIFVPMNDLGRKEVLTPNAIGQLPGAASALMAMVMCAIETGNLLKLPNFKGPLRQDDKSGSLISLSQAYERHLLLPPALFIKYLLRDWVVLRHLAVAAARSSRPDGKNRFKFVRGDEGLELYVKDDESYSPSLPARSRDKLEHTLLLCHQAGLLDVGFKGYRLSPSGRQRVDSFAVRQENRTGQAVA